MSQLFEALKARGVRRTAPKGAILVYDMDPSDSVYLVEEGRLRALLADEMGRELILGDMGPGDVFGEIALDGGPRSAIVRTQTPVTIRVVPGATVREIVASDPALVWSLVDLLCTRVRRLTSMVKLLALNDVYSRLRVFLTQISAASVPPNTDAYDQLTHAEIAQHIGCSREMVSRILSDLAAGGYVKTDKHRISLLKPLPERW